MVPQNDEETIDADNTADDGAYDPEIDGKYCGFCGKPLDSEGYCPVCIADDDEPDWNENDDYDPEKHGRFCSHCAGHLILDGSCLKCAEVTWGDKYHALPLWKRHSAFIFVSIASLFVFLRYMVAWGLLTEIDATLLNNGLNLLALVYAVYMVKVFEETSGKIRVVAEELGIDPPNEAGLMMYLVTDIKPLFNALEESGLSTEDMANFFRVMPKAMDRLKKFIDEEETKLSDIPDDCLNNTKKY